MATSEIKREVASLAKRHPPMGITSDIPDAARMQLRMQEQDKANKAAEKYFPSNPDPEQASPPSPPPPPPKKMAKGGVTRGDGCCMKGHTRGKTV